jgi:hypothetical protein
LINVTNQSKGSKDSLSLIKKCVLAIFSNSKRNEVVIFRKQFLPTIHHYNAYNNTYQYKNLRLKQINKFYNSLTNSNKLNSTNFFKIENSFFSFYLFLFFLKKNFLKFFSYDFFKKSNVNNLIKAISILLLTNTNAKIRFYDLNKYSDWYKYNFSESIYFFTLKNTIKKPSLKLFSTKTKNIYKKHYLSIFKKLNLNYKNLNSLISFLFDKSSLNIIKFNAKINAKKNKAVIKFNESSTNKFIELTKLSDYCFFYIRKNRIFNKGRYSRNRQTYRTGVYWCL